MKNPVHNTHMLLPKVLWKRLRERAKIEGSHVTNLVVEACEAFLSAGKKPDAETRKREV